jgi:hypothetical protein
MGKLQHGPGMRFMEYTVEDLFMNLAKQKADRDMAKSVMDEVLSSDQLVKQIMERNLLPSLCALLRRALGVSQKEKVDHRDEFDKSLVTQTLRSVTHVVRDKGELMLSKEAGNAARLYNFAIKVTKRYEKLPKTAPMNKPYPGV